MGFATRPDVLKIKIFTRTGDLPESDENGSATVLVAIFPVQISCRGNLNQAVDLEGHRVAWLDMVGGQETMIYRDDHSGDLLLTFLESLREVERQKLGMVELRPRAKTVNEVANGDYDFVVNSYDLALILSAFLRACENHKVHMKVTRPSPNKRIIQLIKASQAVTVELWLNVELSVSSGIPIRRVLNGRELVNHLQDRSAEHAIAVKSAVYLTHLYFKNKAIDGPLQQARVAEFHDSLTQNGNPSHEALLRIYSRIHSRNDCLRREDLEEFNRHATSWLKSIGLKPRLSYFRRTRSYLRRVTALRNFVPIIGADGAGKTSLCQELVQKSPERHVQIIYKNLFRNLEYKSLYSISLLFFPAKEKNKFDEQVSGYVILKSVAVLLLWGWTMRPRGKIALLDRYGWDWLVKGIRRPEIPPGQISLHSLFSLLIPRPANTIVAFCRPEKIISRKPEELSKEQLIFIYEQYVEIVTAGRAGDVFFCNTELSSKESALSLENFLDQSSS